MNTPSDLLQAYLATDYRIFAPNGTINLKAQGESEELAALHREHQVSSSAFITAYNPNSEATDVETNEVMQKVLTSEVEAQWTAIPGESADPKGQWPTEKCLLILGVELEEALALGRKYHQVAILFATQDGDTDLYFCEPIV